MLAAIDYLSLKGYKCFVLCPNQGDIVDELNSRNVNSFILYHYGWRQRRRQDESTYGFWKRNIKQQCYNLRKLSYVGVYIKEKKINIIYSNSSVVCIGLYASWRYNIKHVFHLREFGDIDYKLYSIIPKFLLRQLILTSSTVVCISNVLKYYYFGNNNYKNVVVIYNGILFLEQLLEIEKRKVLTLSKSTVDIIIVGILSKEKGQHIAVQAFNILAEKYPFLHLHIVGPGDDSYCRSLIKGDHITERVTFHGYLKNTNSIYGMGDIALICSENEAFGRIVIEAMAWQIPVVGYRKAATSEIIDHGNNGVLYNENTPAALAKGIELLLNNHDLVKAIKKNAFLDVKHNYTVEQYGEQLNKAISNL